MAAGMTSRNGETDQHARLKRLAFLWAQAQGFSVCAMEVGLPKCRYRADVAACRPQPKQIGTTAIFECKQVLCDLRRDNCRTDAARQRLEAICKRRQILETRLRVHYPSLRSADALFPELDSQSFAAIGHRGYARLIGELRTLQNRLYDCTKFDKLIRYRCANLFFLVLPEELFAIRKSRWAGARLLNPMAPSHSRVNQSGAKIHKRIAFAFCTESPWREREP